MLLTVIFFTQAFPAMGMPYKRPAPDKSGMPVYPATGNAAYQQALMQQLGGQSYAPVSCEYASGTPTSEAAPPPAPSTSSPATSTPAPTASASPSYAPKRPAPSSIPPSLIAPVPSVLPPSAMPGTLPMLGMMPQFLYPHHHHHASPFVLPPLATQWAAAGAPEQPYKKLKTS